MIKASSPLFQLFGRLNSWVVGIQYYSDEPGLVDEEVVFELEPNNPFDANAVAVYTQDGTQIGHLPRYDAQYFSPLISEGLIALRGQARPGGGRRDRQPLSIEVYATSKVSRILVRNPQDDWRAVYHNIFVDLWARRSEYCSATLKEFRDRFRPLAHDEPLLPETQFLYRMLKAYIAERQHQEHEIFRQQVLDSVAHIQFGPGMGWPELMVLPLLEATEELAPPIEVDEQEERNPPLPVLSGSSNSDMVTRLPSRCPFPQGARGALVLVHGEVFSFDWFSTTETAQVFWYQLLIAGMGRALSMTPSESGSGVDFVTVKDGLLDLLQQADCKVTPHSERPDVRVIEILTEPLEGYARYQQSELVRMKLNERTCIVDDATELIHTKPNY